MMNGHWTPIIVVLLIIITIVNVDGDCELKPLWGRNVTVHIHIYFVSFITLKALLMG